jgi:hypothetical protein
MNTVRDAGIRRDDHLRDVERVGDLRGLRRAGASERDECELARVVPLLHRARPDRARHVGVRDRDDPLRGFEEAEPEHVGHLLHRGDGELTVELHLTAEEPVGVDSPEDDVRVGERGLDAALAVGGGAG